MKTTDGCLEIINLVNQVYCLYLIICYHNVSQSVVCPDLNVLTRNLLVNQRLIQGLVRPGFL